MMCLGGWGGLGPVNSYHFNKITKYSITKLLMNSLKKGYYCKCTPLIDSH